VLVLLPPSEGKAAGGDGPALDLDRLSLPALGAARREVLDELVALCAGNPVPDGADGTGPAALADNKAMAVLGLTPGLRGEVARNAALRDAPTRPAAELYTGVLYDALDLAGLAPAARARADRELLIFSGLWGALRTGDAVPAYRCPIGVRLPGVGALAAHWRRAMRTALPEAAAEGLVLDLRSSAYAAAWRPGPAEAARTATVRVLHVRTVGGVEKRSVVSHFNKATKGRLVRALLTAGADPATPAALAGTLRELGFTVETAPEKGGALRLDVLVTDIHART
jgi:cytoplasmic iron level regulating protein YaaA (DUF328/UPF0246 family)